MDALALQHRLPILEISHYQTVSGALLSYVAPPAAMFKRAAVYVDKILKGAKPSDLPVERPTKFEFIVNLETAKQLGITIPPIVLFQADKVIR